VAFQQDGKLVVGGVKTPAGQHFAVMRFTPAGALDATFGTNGVAQTRVGTSSHVASAIAVQPDGKILLAGFTRFVGQNSDFALLRYTSDGALDTTFGTGGLVLTDFGGETDQARTMVLLPDGRIVLAGQTVSDDLAIADMAFARYLPDGSLDPAFGTGGRAVVDVRGTPSEVRSISVLGNGQIVAAGLSKNPVGSWSDVVVARLRVDGSVDAAFGQAGYFISAFGGPGNDIGAGLVVDSFDRLLVAGLAGGNDFGVLRVTTAGTLDSVFGLGGRARFDFSGRNDTGSAVVSEAGGKTLVVGSSLTGATNDAKIGVVRFLSDGAVDPAFGLAGSTLVSLPVGFTGAGSIARAVALDRCGAVVVGGWVEDVPAGLSRVGLVRIRR